MTVCCAFCDAAIPDETIARRHYSEARLARPICCNREHEVERRKRDGIYKDMSLAGKGARSQAVTQSNREHPRRKK